MRVNRYLPMTRAQRAREVRDKISRQVRAAFGNSPSPIDHRQAAAPTGGGLADGSKDLRSEISEPKYKDERTPMALQTAQSKEHAHLIRELVAFCGKKFSEDTDLRYRAALERRLFQVLPDLAKGIA